MEYIAFLMEEVPAEQREQLRLAKLDLTGIPQLASDEEPDEEPATTPAEPKPKPIDPKLLKQARKLGYQPLSGPRGVADDLKQLPGVTPRIEKQVNDLGLFHLWQIAELSPATARNISTKVLRADAISKSKLRGRPAKGGEAARH